MLLPLTVGLLRSLFVLFWLIGSLYGVLAFLPYTFYAFIKAPPHPAIPNFAHYHAVIVSVSWCALFLSFALERRLRHPAVIAALAIVGLLGIALTLYSPLSAAAPSQSTYLWALAALLPIYALLVLPAAPGGTDDRRSHWGVTAALFGAPAFWLLVTTGDLLAAYSSGRPLFDTRFWQLNAAMAVKTVAGAIFLSAAMRFLHALTATPRAAIWRRPGSVLILAAVLTPFVRDFLKQSLSFRGPFAVGYACALSLALAVALVVGAPAARLDKKIVRVVAFLAAALAASLSLTAPVLLEPVDWNGVGAGIATFVLALLCGFIAVTLTPPAAYSPRLLRQSISALLAAMVLVLMPGLEAFATSRPGVPISFKPCPWSPVDVDAEDLCSYLERHTNIQEELRNEPSFQLTSNLASAPSKRPNVIVLVFDSLRTDYLSPYAPDVDFTPNIHRFAEESYVFRNAFTPYAGTVMAEPAVWAGAELLHKQYIQPFNKVNSLEKLLDAAGYTKVVSMDTVLAQLLPVSMNLVSIDGNREDWGALDFCDSWRAAMHAIDGDRAGTPKFFFSQPMNVHRVALQRVKTALRVHRSYGARGARYASELQRVDACFGEFVSAMKQRGLWEDSIVVLTADHGDALGDHGRQGHSYLLSPEVVRIPLIVRLPASLRRDFVTDTKSVAMLHDITPTLYRLLGYSLDKAPSVAGRSLFRHRADPPMASRGAVLVASDTKPIYGVIADGGRVLYVLDVDKREAFTYDIASGERSPSPSPEIEASFNRLIYREVERIAATYGYR